MLTPNVPWRHLALRLLVLALLAGSTILPSHAQPTAAAPEADTAIGKYWIFFQDKPGSVEAGASHVTEAARLRRQRRGGPVPTGLDVPVAEVYLARLRALGVEPVVRSRWLNAVSAYLTPRQRATLEAFPFVRSIRPVQRLSPTAAAEAPAPLPAVFQPGRRVSSAEIDFGRSWEQLADINAIDLLNRGINGTGVRLGFLDTEFGDFEHPAFAHLLADGRLLGYRNFAQGPQDNRHGLSVASVAVGFEEGSLVGPGWGAQVLAATTEYAPSETNQEEDNFVAGLEWMEAQGADVINVSLGYTTFDAGERSYTPAHLDGDTGVTTVAADRAAALGVVVVTSAGNEGGCGTPESCWYYIGTPADADSVIAVGAVRRDSVRASFSSFGPTADGRIKPDVAAMGQSVWLAAPGGYAFSSGTSFASPLVAGVVAQILQVNPDLTPVDVRDLLRSTASQAGSPDNALGWGIVNAEAAVARAVLLGTGGELPDVAVLSPPYPNPFSGTTTFEVRAPAGHANVTLTVYDLLGRQAMPARRHTLSEGINWITLDGNDLAAGVYLYVLEGDAVHASGKMVVVK